MNRPILSRRGRWAVPAGALAVTGAVIAAVLAPSAQASPILPARTSAQLLAAVSGRDAALPPFTGTVVEDAKLGLPDLPGVADPTSVTSLLTGSHSMRIWYGDSSHLRLSVPGEMSEGDVFVNGRTAWYWQSSPDQATKFLLPADAAKTHQLPKVPELTPQQAAQQALAAVGPTTTVSLQRNVEVAGQAAYQLVLAPKSSSSLIGQVRIAVDGSRYIPLRVQVFARGATSPSFQVGFTSISFVRPAASNFSFTPPPGAKVSTEKLGDMDQSGQGMKDRSLNGSRTFGTSWLTVAELPASELSGALAGMGGFEHSSSQAAPGQGNAAVGGAVSSSAQSVAGTPGGGGPGISGSGLFGLAMRSAKNVHGSWGSGQLLHTGLLSVLMTSDGRVFLGAVTPAVLYHDAAQAK